MTARVYLDYNATAPLRPEARAAMLEALAAVVRAVSIPVIAIGGINRDNIEAVGRAGAGGVAVISAIFSAPDPGEATAALRSELDRVSSRF